MQEAGNLNRGSNQIIIGGDNRELAQLFQERLFENRESQNRMLLQNNEIQSLRDRVAALERQVRINCEEITLLTGLLQPEGLEKRIKKIHLLSGSELKELWHTVRVMTGAQIESLWQRAVNYQSQRYLEFALLTKEGYQPKEGELQKRLAAIPNKPSLNGRGHFFYENVNFCKEAPRYIPLSCAFGSAEGAAPIAEVLRGDKEISELYLERNNFDGEGIIAQALAINRTVNWFYIQCNRLGPKGAEALAKAFQVNECLKSLKIGCREFSAEEAAILGDSISKNRNITKLDLDIPNFSSTAALAFTAPFTEICNLSSLKISCINFGPIGVHFGRVLSATTQLTSLQITCTSMNEEAASSLAAVLRTEQKIREFRLCCDSLPSAGVTLLRDALQANKKISLLDFSIKGLEGALALAEVIRTNQTISEIYLDWLKLGPQAGNALAEVLRASTTITEFVFCTQFNPERIRNAFNAFANLMNAGMPSNPPAPDPAGVQAIAKALLGSQTVKKIHLSYDDEYPIFITTGVFPSELNAIVETIKISSSIKQLGFSYSTNGEELAVADAYKMNLLQKEMPARFNNTPTFKNIEDLIPIIGTMLKANSSINTLFIEGKMNRGSQEATIFADTLQVNRNVTQFDFPGFWSSFPAYERIQEALNRNRVVVTE